MTAIQKYAMLVGGVRQAIRRHQSNLKKDLALARKFRLKSERLLRRAEQELEAA